MKTETQIRPDADEDDANFTNWHEFQIQVPNSCQFVQFVSLRRGFNGKPSGIAQYHSVTLSNT